MTGLFHDETGFPSTNPEVVDRLIRRLHDKIEQAKPEIFMVKEFHTDDCRILVVS